MTIRYIPRTRKIKTILTTALILSVGFTLIYLFAPSTAKGKDRNNIFGTKAKENDINDQPLITSFTVTPATLQKNRINFVTISFKFIDEKRNVHGGTMIINFEFDNKNLNYFVAYPLTHKKFMKKKGKFQISFGLLAVKWKSVKVWGYLQDADKTFGNEVEPVTLTVSKKSSGGKQGRKIGQTAYDFTLLNHKNKKVSLSDFRGKVVLLDFSTMWCGPCQTEAGHMNDLYRKYNNQGFTIITVLSQGYTSNPSTAEDLKEWITRFKLKTPVLSDPFWGVYDSYYSKEFRPSSRQIPNNFLLDRNGKLRWHKLGYLPEIAAEMEAKIKQLLQEQQ